MTLWKSILRALALTALAFSAAAAAAETTAMKENFDGSKWQPGPVKSSGGEPGMSITTERAASLPHSFKVARERNYSNISLPVGGKVPPRHNYRMSFRIFIDGQSNGGVTLIDGKNRDICNLYVRGANDLLVHNLKKEYIPCAGLPKLKLNQWLTFEVAADTVNNIFKVKLTEADGTVYASDQENQLTSTEPPVRVRISNCLPRSCVVYYDDFFLAYDNDEAKAQRTELAAISGETLAPGERKTHVLAPAADVGAFAIEGAKPGKIKVRMMNRLGQWIEPALDFTLTGEKRQELSGFSEYEDSSVVEIVNTGSAPLTYTRLAILSAPVKSSQARDREFNAAMSAEDRLPVYDQQYAGCDRAEFKFINRTQKSIDVTVRVTGRKDGKIAFPERKLAVPPGFTSIWYDLKDLPNGEYITTVSRADGASFRRLLRHATAPKCTTHPREDLSGQKIFFPDGFYLASHQNLKFLPVQADWKLIPRDNPFADDTFIFIGDKLFQTADGKIAVNAHSFDRRYTTASMKKWHAVAADDTMNEWQIGEGHLTLPAGQVDPFYGHLPEAARSDFSNRRGKLTYSWYDPAKHGPADLRQIDLVWVNPGDGSNVLSGNKVDWQIVDPPRFSTWPIWYRSPGEAVIMTRQPVIGVMPGKCEIEPENSAADVNVGQWLSDDKTLFRARARRRIRHEPFQIPYDNAPHIARIDAVFRSSDGVNWEQTYMAPPSLAKPVGSQHYGGKQFTVKGGAGLRVGVLTDYDALDQTFNLELIYSWDGFRWTRFQEAPAFLPAGKAGDRNSFRCGNHFPSGFVKNGRCYHLLTWSCNYTHFQSEVVAQFNDSVKHITGKWMKDYFGPRQLDQWPPFKEYFQGSWDRLAEDTRTASDTVGVMSYREDGWFRAEAGNDEAKFVTLPIRAAGGMTVNAEVAPGGFLELEVIDAGGRVAASRRLEKFDAIDETIFDKLPEGRFTIRGKMKNARLYTLGFAK